MNEISKLIIPLFVVFVLLYGFKKKVNIYDVFMDGAKEGLNLSISIFPAIIGMIFAINIFLDSNVLDSLFKMFIPALNNIGIPYEILPMAFLRPISGTATLSIMNSIFIEHGPDSFIGRLASIVQGCTDTTLYVLILYFGSVRISKSRYALKVGLFADFVGIILAIILTKVFF